MRCDVEAGRPQWLGRLRPVAVQRLADAVEHCEGGVERESEAGIGTDGVESPTDRRAQRHASGERKSSAAETATPPAAPPEAESDEIAANSGAVAVPQPQEER